MSGSAIYAGHVAHMRPGKHRLAYRVFMLALDLDEVPTFETRLKLFSHNRFNLVSVFDRDHGEGRNEAIRPCIESKLMEAGIAWDGGRVVLLTMPRVLNYAFNPLSVYFCYRRSGELAALVHEVSNTFGERHFYVLPTSGCADGKVLQRCKKAFFVSPFLEMDLSYQFEVTPPGATCAIAIIVRRGDDAIALTASFVGARLDLTDANLLRAWSRNPLMTVKVIVGIHWEALKMWLKGVRYLGRPERRERRRHAH